MQCVANTESKCKKSNAAECKSQAFELKCAECDGGYAVSSTGTCSQVSRDMVHVC